jgi:putative peptidoglycan lipid II flippase
MLFQIILTMTAYLASRLLGMVREMVLAWRFGASELTDLYNASFLIPDILNYLLAAQAFSVVLVPMMTECRTADGKRLNRRGEELLAAILGPMTIASILLAAIGLWFTPQLLGLLYPRYAADPAQLAGIVRLTRIVLPAQVFFVVGGIFVAAQRAVGDFRANQFQGIVYNAGIILGGLLLGSVVGIAGFSWGALAGAFVGAFLVPLTLARRTVALRWSLDLGSRDLAVFLKRQVPLMVGVTVLTVDTWLLRLFGARPGIPAGTLTCLGYAYMLSHVPIGLMGQATGQVSLTTLSGMLHERGSAALAEFFGRLLRLSIFASLLASGAMAATAGPLVELILGHGAFTAGDAARTSRFLVVMAAGLPAFASHMVLVNGYYVRRDTLRPMIVGTIGAALAAAAYWALSASMAGPGIAAASSVSLWVAFALLRGDYLRRYERDGGRELDREVGTLARGAALALVSFALSRLAVSAAGPFSLPGKLAPLAEMLLAGGVFAFIPAGYLLMAPTEEAVHFRNVGMRVRARIRR